VTRCLSFCLSQGGDLNTLENVRAQVVVSLCVVSLIVAECRGKGDALSAWCHRHVFPAHCQELSLGAVLLLGLGVSLPFLWVVSALWALTEGRDFSFTLPEGCGCCQGSFILGIRTFKVFDPAVHV
jgi:hypothetical protein